ncbi:MAG: hypothetical protein H6681_02535 [Desulfobacteraceae bacterium]|nr:hypothetical protein [Desulfobacteraceae bacterium]MCB9494304.1 hypothetical protein [Desulfobacteraceae bacterium]
MSDFNFNLSPDDTMRREDFFVERLKLLMVMCRAFIKGYPVEGYRREAVLKNAEHVFFETADWGGQYLNVREKALYINGVKPDSYFYQRVKLLALMAKSFAQGNPAGYFRVKAVEDTINEIESTLKLDNNEDVLEMHFFNVA